VERHVIIDNPRCPQCGSEDLWDRAAMVTGTPDWDAVTGVEIYCAACGWTGKRGDIRG
jgi:predicted RNA-binding Zn-ribbon protein involved in translation (DUF1610 family)